MWSILSQVNLLMSYLQPFANEIQLMYKSLLNRFCLDCFVDMWSLLCITVDCNNNLLCNTVITAYSAWLDTIDPWPSLYNLDTILMIKLRVCVIVIEQLVLHTRNVACLLIKCHKWQHQWEWTWLNCQFIT